MPDLHGWITQQINAHEHLARETTSSLWQIALGEDSVAATVLRRCTADRKILEEHRPQGGGWPSHYACEGCGYDGGYCPEPITRHINDCPTLLALAEGYGLTDEQRAQLDRPELERPTPTGPSLIPEPLAEAIARRLLANFIGFQPAGPSPEEKALEILEPDLKKISGYVPMPKEIP
ncbi:hypothetical protein [Streptomyces alboflavus]|uniref:hypothetical protein n=1 Tax=Streptomyces alboflavus TaxID=67267 RepID=UPI0004C11693|nr:hypothetical protein [Streptomyces alboflavus]